jgi:hypothetical protein
MTAQPFPEINWLLPSKIELRASISKPVFTNCKFRQCPHLHSPGLEPAGFHNRVRKRKIILEPEGDQMNRREPIRKR